MNLKAVCKTIVTLGPIGYLPASGTIASLLTLPLAVMWPVYLTPRAFTVLIVLLFLTSYLMLSFTRDLFDCHDPRQVVIDEVVGCLIAFYGPPGTMVMCVIRFALFRFLDITKLFGLSHLEARCTGPFGILIDDVWAGMLTALVVNLIFHRALLP